MALVSELTKIPPSYVLLILFGGIVLFSLIKSKLYRLDHVPGPFLSRYTDAYRAYLAWRYSGQDVNLFMKVHSEYGDVVRVGPRSVSVLDPAAVQSIYGIKARFNKGPNVNAFNVPGVPKSVLAIIDEHEHAKFRRPIQNAYSLTNLKGYEPYVDDIIEKLAAVLDRHATEQKQVNLSLWSYYWSYEVIGKLTFGSPTGYIEKGTDFNGLIRRQVQFLDYVNIVSQMPSLHNFLANNPIFKVLPHRTFDFVKFAKERVAERLRKYDPSNTARPDLLSHFIEARKAFPEVVTDNQVFVYGLTNVIAGSLSTSHVLDELIKFLTINPGAQDRINNEVIQAGGNNSFPITFDQAKKAPYLEAVILEAFRIHSVANLSSERVVGADGLSLPSGIFLPPGTYVGINPAAMNRRTDIFGPRPEVFDPSRWLQKDETQEEFLERKLQMDRATLTFGQGSRSCLGKNVVQLELFKLIATLCTRYTLHGVGKSELFKVHTTIQLRDRS